jgi:acyl dehydratase
MGCGVAVASVLTGTSSGEYGLQVEPAWTMAFSAALGDTATEFFDNRQPSMMVAHPLFPMCLEWRGQPEAWLALGVPSEQHGCAVHYEQDSSIFRLLRPGELIRIRPTIAGIRRHRAGALVATQFTARDESDRPVWQGLSTHLFRGIDVTGKDSADLAAAWPDFEDSTTAPLRSEAAVALSPGAAHVYAACARIRNPIHTDISVAAAAGLPAPILHGSASLALAVSRVVAAEANGDPARVLRVRAGFRAMVQLPNELSIRIHSKVRTADGSVVVFTAWNQEGVAAIRRGAVLLSPDPPRGLR